MLQKLTSAIPAAPNRSGPASDVLTSGIVGVGKPAGTAPTTATPFASRLSRNTTAQPNAAATSGDGIRGTKCLSTRIRTNSATPTLNVVTCVSFTRETASPTV